ncbi:WG containing repeat-containing protein [Mucilaginibacter gossypiicola]|uniref:WG containing repeat-containing protein n=1 Tax=Mucilaginibacter gossypiicola TaxID=551995 RepID=A0A1H8T0I5_9SPHI|nr:WG repeat-containing protein [Mucilaginibacter gossypiicola]SEO84084.1 WG containing repeat-containing protein [Mucilaginibacter gossypiicola]
MKHILLLTSAILAFGCNTNGQQKKQITKPADTTKPTGLASEIIVNVPEKHYNGLKPGDIAPDAVKVKGDDIKDLTNGVAVIYRGTASALIDVTGKFLIDWGDGDNVISVAGNNFVLFRIYNTVINQSSLINVKDETVIPYWKNLAFSDRNTAVTGKNADNKPVSIKLQQRFPALPNGFDTTFYGNALYRSFEISRFIKSSKEIEVRRNAMRVDRIKKFGFVDASGKMLIPFEYDGVSDFHDGLAAVKKTDQFGKEQWGFINEQGKLVIPFQYSIEPGDFHEGLALVVPIEQADFNYAYIDKTGNLALKVGDGKPNGIRYYPCDGGGSLNTTGIRDAANRFTTVGYFMNGYACCKQVNGETMLLDHKGQIHTINEIVQDKSLGGDAKGVRMMSYDEQGFLIDRTHFPRPNQTGLINYKGQTLFPPAFNEVKPDSFSHYAIASVTDKSTMKITKGIINSQGVFVLILDNKTTF